MFAPTVMALGPVTQTFWEHLVDALPGILAQLAVLIGSLGAFYRVWANRTNQIVATTEAIDAKADLAAKGATAAAQKAEAVHITTKAIAEQAKAIAEQTNGQLSRLLDDKDALQQALRQIVTILSAREGKPAGTAIRSEDVPPALDGMTPPKEHEVERELRQGPADRRKTHTQE